LSSFGTPRKSSRQRLEMIGTIMIVRIRIAANTLEPTGGGGPKIGRKPSAPCSAGPSVLTMNGPRTRIPQSPRTTVGTAASSSTSGPTTERIQRGASSVRKRAIAIAIGVARSSAPNEVTTVPKMNDLAPNSSLFWSQAWVVRNFRPNLSIAGQASARTSRVIRARRTTLVTAASSVTT
jgi:hypothetical protein